MVKIRRKKLYPAFLFPFSINVYGPYKWGSKFDLGGKKVKCQHRTIILAILVDLLSPIICAKIRTQGLFGYGEEDF